MKSILIEDLLKMDLDGCSTSIRFTDTDGIVKEGYAIAKPLNFDKDYLDKETRKAMAQEVLDGHAIAVHFSEDEIACGEIPTLYKRYVES